MAVPSSTSIGPIAFAGLCPTWNDAVTQLSVNNSVQAQIKNFVQPRLDNFADKLAEIVASAQGEVRDLERMVEQCEVRTENRLISIEGRVAILADAATKTEQRERDLNMQIAGIAGSILKGVEEEGSKAMHDLHSGGITERLDSIEEICHSCADTVQKLDDRLGDLEENTRNLLKSLADELRSVTAAVAAPTDDTQEARLEWVGDEVRELREMLDERNYHDSDVETSQRLDVLESRMQSQRRNIEAFAAQLDETIRDVRAQVSDQAQHCDEQRDATRQCRSEQQSITSSLDEINLRLGAFKVKTDGLEGRLISSLERVERSEKLRDIDKGKRGPESSENLFRDVVKHCNAAIASQLESHLDEIDRLCDERVSEALERRLELLSGEPLLTTDLHDSHRRSMDSRMYGASRKRSERSHGDHHQGARGSSKLGTPAQAHCRGDLTRRETSEL